MALVAYYKLNKNGDDFSGSNFHMTSSSNITYTTGVVGRSAHFNGTNSYMRTNSNVTTTTNQLTIAAWFKVEAGGSNYRCALHKATSTAVGTSEFWIGVSAGQNITATIGANSGAGWAGGETTIQRVEGQWVHALATWNGSNVRVYINGVFSKQYALSSLTTITNPTRIGASSDGSNYQFSGDIDEVRVYDHHFSDSDVLELYNSRPETITFSQNKLTSKIITSHNNKTIVPFTTVGSTNWTPPAGVTKVDVLIVAGGGGGGADGGNSGSGGGGGAGGLIYKKGVSVSNQSYPIVVGSGGVGATSRSDVGTSGENSEAFGLIAIGGGRGGTFHSSTQYAEDGGSGGGTFGRVSTSNSGSGDGLQLDIPKGGFGYPGGIRTGTSSSSGGAGGGGASEPGEDSDGSSNGKAGGKGKNFSNSFGTSYGESGWFSGGGAGGDSGGGSGSGGLGGGGSSEVNGIANTGGGGGGGNNNSMAAGNGGSGIVLIKYSTSNIKLNV